MFNTLKCRRLTIVSCLCAAICWSGRVLLAADDVEAILQQIKSESTHRPAPQPASPDAAIEKTARSQPSKAESRQPKPQQQPKQETFSGPVWGPKDKLPKEINGHGLAGTFVIAGQFQGSMMLEAAEDNLNPFCRTFVVSNKRLDLPDNYVIPPSQRETLTIPRNRPLILLEKGPLAYYYVHMH